MSHTGPFGATVRDQQEYQAAAKKVKLLADGVADDLEAVEHALHRAAADASLTDAEALSIDGRRNVAVPISHPRYQRKTRLNRTMAVTDSASEDTGRSPSTLLNMRSRERLTVRQGAVTHGEDISYRAYACYRHGSRQVHTQSVGYSSEGDLVLVRRDVMSADEAASHSYRRRYIGVEGAVCLNPKAKPVDPKVEGEDPTGRWERRIKRLSKYPGVRCPKNRKTRNRLINDHLAIPSMRKLFEMAQEDSDPDGMRQPAAATFKPLPAEMDWLVDTTEEMQAARLEQIGVTSEALSGLPTRVAKQKQLKSDTAAFRYLQLQTRMKSELQHAMTTEFMPGFMADVEERIEKMITGDAACGSDGSAPTSIDVVCRDGYGRLITHGIAAFYKLPSASETSVDGVRVTKVSLPRKRVQLPDQRLTGHIRGDRTSSTSPSTSSPLPPAPPLLALAAADDGDDEQQAATLGRRKRFRKRNLRRAPPPAFIKPAMS